jgi:hypothetical protein
MIINYTRMVMANFILAISATGPTGLGLDD